MRHLTLRAKCYYYARKVGAAVDFDGYKRWVEINGRDSDVTNGLGEQVAGGALQQQEDVSGGGDGGMGEAPKPASFAEICDMIAEGKPIPGIKDIPDTILEGQASENQTAARRKPWEKGDGGSEKPSWMS